MLTPFLGAIKKKCAENFEINALMRKNLLCKWHIVRAWRRKIQKLYKINITKMKL